MQETALHRDLKRLSLAWAQQRGFRIAAAEVSVPCFGCRRIDAAAYRPDYVRAEDQPGGRMQSTPRLGATVIFECKASRADFLRDSRRLEVIGRRLEALHAQRALYEESLPRYYPSLRTGEGLFPEFDGYELERAGFEPYDTIQKEIRQLSRRLHEQTKFDKLSRWRAANLHFLVAPPGVVKRYELPDSWGLLIHSESGLAIEVAATWQEASEHHRWHLLLRIAMNGTRAVNQDLAVDLTSPTGARTPAGAASPLRAPEPK